MFPDITLTGADSSIDHAELFRLSAEFPLVEWGVLYHQERQGNGRYPTFEWITTLCKQMSAHSGARVALHVCGRGAINEFFLGTGAVSQVVGFFGRIQLNLTAANIEPALLVDAIARYPNKVIITQHNAANESLLEVLRGLPNHALLFDQSGGRGISPAFWPAPLPGKSTFGYAGGLGPDNLGIELPRIQRAAGLSPFWIDIEEKLRTGDLFDLSLARRCLMTCNELALVRPS